MSVEEVVAYFEELIKNPQKLQDGYTIINELINNVDQFCITTCKIITSNEIELNFRKNVGYIMKNVLKDNWMVNKVVVSQRDVSHYFDPSPHPLTSSSLSLTFFLPPPFCVGPTLSIIRN